MVDATPLDLGQEFRDHWSSVLASLVGFLGDFDLAEEATQEAFTAAAATWHLAGRPINPRGWLLSTARNRAIDRVRRERVARSKVAQLEAEVAAEQVASNGFADERLELIFTCCHPALAVESQVALTLRALGGLSTADIARAFLVPEATMAQRLTRAKRKVKAAGIPFRVPPADLLSERLAAALAVVYLIFNDGYSGSVRSELAESAIWLGRALVALMPDEPECKGLLALMLFNESRRAARFRDDEMVLLADQDRALWDRAQIDEAEGLLASVGGDGVYVLQARIAGEHAHDICDWAHISLLLGELYAITGSPVVELNRAVAVAEVDGPPAALEIVVTVADQLDDYRYMHATRADLLRRMGRGPDAVAAYRRALDLTTDAAERRFLSGRIASLGGDSGGGEHPPP